MIFYFRLSEINIIKKRKLFYMKHIVKVNNIQEAKDSDIRPIIALDNSGVLFFEGAKVVPEGFVDFELPSGILWSTKNIGATNGDTAESWYGNYYAWGEIETKEIYDWDNYKYANGNYDKLTKYCNNSNYGNNGFTDDLTQLVPEDDVATVINSAWRMPTKEDFEELVTLPQQWITNYNGVSGLNGRVFIGINGNTLFIPTSGFRYNSYFLRGDCCLWSSSLYLDNTSRAYMFYFRSDYIGMDSYDRLYGYCVRPVC